MDRRPRFPATQATYYALKGGLDLVTPRVAMDPGRLFDAQNYEPLAVGGYRRIDGHERSDGQTAPTGSPYWLMTATVTGTLAAGQTITGLTSGATGKLLLVDGSTLILGRVSGTFQNAEALQVGGVTQATATSVATTNGANWPADHVDYRQLAADDRRADILTVPGSGSVRGVFVLNDVVYALRDNAGGTAGDLYRQSASGWVLMNLGREIQFTGGTNNGITVGQTVTGATSGATAVARAVLLRTGSWAGTGVGTIVFASVTGAFQNGENLQVGGVTKAVASGADTAITRQPGGRVESVLGNFTGAAATKKVYAADGVNLGFEFDGTTYVPIRTDMTSDVPKHVAVHRNYLWFSFGASLQKSSIANPYMWTAVTGSAEFAMGDEITGIVPLRGDSNTSALAVFTEGEFSILYGASTSSFQLIPSGFDVGFKEYTAQSVSNDTYGLTARGVQSLKATLNYGDYEFAALSFQVQPLLERKAAAGTLPCASVTLREKNQYRLFFDDGTGLVFGLTGNKVTGILPLDYGKVVTCVCNAVLSTGEEVTYFGSEDGYVYKDNVGTSFDGDEIEAWIWLAFNNLSSPRVRKQYRYAIFEVLCEGYSQVRATYDLGYGTPLVASTAVQQNQNMVGGGGYWDQFTWDDFIWDSMVVPEAKLSIDGAENNIAFLFYSNRAQDDSHAVQGTNLLYTPRRLVRGGGS